MLPRSRRDASAKAESAASHWDRRNSTCPRTYQAWTLARAPECVVRYWRSAVAAPSSSAGCPEAVAR
jgi:hypothetical protein